MTLRVRYLCSGVHPMLLARLPVEFSSELEMFKLTILARLVPITSLRVSAPLAALLTV